MATSIVDISADDGSKGEGDIPLVRTTQESGDGGRMASEERGEAEPPTALGGGDSSSSSIVGTSGIASPRRKFTGEGAVEATADTADTAAAAATTTAHEAIGEGTTAAGGGGAIPAAVVAVGGAAAVTVGDGELVRIDSQETLYPRVRNDSETSSSATDDSPPDIVDHSLSCASRGMTKIPREWGEKYGEIITAFDASYNNLHTLENLHKFQKLETLVLDNNLLGDDIFFPIIPSLKTLCLNNNDFRDMDFLLQQITLSYPNLQYLSLLKNPACPDDLNGADEIEYRLYRIRVVRRFPKLQFLDSRAVSNRERNLGKASETRHLSHESSESLNDAAVVSAEIVRAQSERFTVYKLVVGKPKAVIFRRYNDFYMLHKQLQRDHPSLVKKLNLPSKRLLGNNFDSKFIETRRLALQEYIHQVIEDPTLRKTKAVKDFLTLKVMEGSSSDEEDEDSHGGTKHPRHSSESAYAESVYGKHLTKATPDDFNFLSVIGKGSFGTVMLASNKQDGKMYAIKVIKKKSIRPEEAKQIMIERNVLKENIRHPFLIGLRFAFQTAEKLYYVLDYVNGGELFTHLQREKRFPEERCKLYIAEIASALGYLHELGVIYRDLKPENVLLDSEGHVALTDFGLAKAGVARGQTTATFCGTPEYLAPEVLRKQQYGKEVDWWCLGCVLYEMLFGLPPFYSQDMGDMFTRILYSEVRFNPRVKISEDAKDFIVRLLDRNPTTRLGAGREDLESLKQHAFFVGVDWEKLVHRQYKPIFVPEVTSPLDLKYFDSDVVNEVSKSVMEDTNMDITVDNAFCGFSFTATSDDETDL